MKCPDGGGVFFAGFELSSRRNAETHVMSSEHGSEDLREVDPAQTTSMSHPEASQEARVLFVGALGNSSTSREGSLELVNLPGPAEVTQPGSRMLPYSKWLRKFFLGPKGRWWGSKIFLGPKRRRRGYPQ